MTSRAISARLSYLGTDSTYHNGQTHHGRSGGDGVPRASIPGRFCRHVQPMMDIGPERNQGIYKSQYGQDAWIERNILRFLKEHNPKTFVEFGARDGVEHSNTFIFDKRDGYKGVLVEAVPTEYDMLEMNRKRWNVSTYHGVVCPSDEEGTEKEFLGLTGALSGLGKVVSDANIDETEALVASMKQEAMERKGVYDEERVKLPCLNLRTLLQAAGIREITIMSMDCEGCEEEVLKDFDFEAFPVKILLVERTDDCDYTSRLMGYLEALGFVALNWESSDVIFVHSSVYMDVMVPSSVS